MTGKRQPPAGRPPDRHQALIDQCVALGRVLGRFRDERGDQDEGKVADYRGRIASLPVPDLERERGQLELEKRRRFTATSDNLLRSSGPGVLTKFLPDAGLLAFVRRVDLLDLATSGASIPEPLTSRIVEMTESGGPTDEHMKPREIAQTVMALRAIACSVCVIPPGAYFEDAAFDVDQIDPAACRPQFVMAGAHAADGQLPIYVPENEQRADGWRGLSRKDLREIAQAVIDNGPGAMLAFRLRQESPVEGVREGRVNGRPAEPGTGDRLPVGGKRSGQRRGALRAVGAGQDG